MDRLRAAGADLAGLSEWVSLCGVIGPPAVEHAAPLLRLAQEEQLPIGLRLRAIDALESMGSAAGPSITALLDIPLPPFARSRVLTVTAHHRLRPLDEIVDLFLKEMFAVPEDPASLYLRALVDLLDPSEYGRHPTIIEAIRRVSKEHQDPEMRKVATWHLEYGYAAPPGVYRLPAGSDMRNLYILNVPVPETGSPADGWGLVLVLPGGDASAELQPFVTRIAREALPDGYLLAQMVTPPRLLDKSIVWPLEQDHLRELDFSSEDFARAVIDDVKTRYQVDESRLFVIGWAEGGMAAYALIVDQKLSVRGGLVAMSDFKSARLPEPIEAEGKPIYILHSLEDEVIAARFAQEACDHLADSGALTRLESYSGGHGWTDDAFRKIRHAIEWLDRERP